MKTESKPSQLAPYRVLDLTNEIGFLCGRMLADLGADVIKVERPGGDPTRNIGPFYHEEAHAEKSLFWFFYNANKRGITLNIETIDGKEIFKQLVKKADFVIESFPPGYMDSLGLGYEALSKINPRVIVTSITPFGPDGPYGKFKSADIVNLALSGWMNRCGDDDRAPVQMGVPFQPWFHASGQATCASLVAHYYRERTGQGQQVNATPLPHMVHFSQAVRYYTTKQPEGRHGQKWEWSGRPLVRYVWECKDGFVCFSITGGARFGPSQRALIAWMDGSGMASDYLKNLNWDEMDFGSINKEIRDRFEEPVAAFFKTKTKKELFKESVDRGIVLFPANTAKEIFEENQLETRGYWDKVEHPELGATLTYPGPFFKSTETAWQMKRRAPLIGEHNSEIYAGELGLSKEDIITLKQENVI